MRPLSMSCAAFVALVCGACAGKTTGSVPAQQPPAKTPHPSKVSITAWHLDETAWLQRVLVEHPLVGKLYVPSKDALVESSELLAALPRSRFILLGEKHDNRDHHLLQAYLLGKILAQQHDTAVAFEMLDIEKQAAIDVARSAHPSDADALGMAVDWDRTGWPEWSMYRPLFLMAIQSHARIIAANLSREHTRAIVHAGASASPVPVERLPTLTPAQGRALESELAASHCGMLPEPMVKAMALAQRVRDWTLAERLNQANMGSGAVLIAGAEHVRQDRGVPLTLAALGHSQVLSVAMIEVQRGEVDPSKYLDVADGVQPFDFVIFTPRVDESDPCEQMRSGG